MRKIQPYKNWKNSLENSQKNKRKNQAKNNEKSAPKIRWNSRTMEWLQLPTSIQKEFKQNLIAMEVDFMQYTCYKISEPLKAIYNILGFTGQIDDDNSNIEYNYNLNLSLTRINTAMGYAYIITFLSPWFAPLPIMSIEVYNESKLQMLKTEWKIVFYWAYFIFRELLAEEAPEALRFHNFIEISKTFQFQLKNGKEIQKPLYKRTRVDIATDVSVPMSKKWLKTYIKPHKTSKHAVRPYNYDEITDTFQSIAYIPRLTRWIWIRCYNKVLDIQKKNKQAWHPTYWTEQHPIVTRLEIVYGGDTAQDSIENLMKYTKYRLLGDQDTKLHRKTRPKSQYSPLSAYEYFRRYAKNHWKTLREVLDDVWEISLKEENKDKDF